MKSGFISIIGRTNVGKSTLLNSIIGEKISITANRVQTTRNKIIGIYNENNYQLIFIDTPGIHKPKNSLSQRMNKISRTEGLSADVILFMVDSKFKEGLGDDLILKELKNIDKPKYLLINKIDLFKREDLVETLKYYEDLKIFTEVLTLRADKNLGVKELVEKLKGHLKDDISYFPADVKTDKSDEFYISEIIREKTINLLKDEIPHHIYINVNLKDEKNLLRISAEIITSKELNKKIIIGKGGEMLKKIGSRARLELEGFYNTKIFLEIRVKVKSSWTDNSALINSIVEK